MGKQAPRNVVAQGRTPTAPFISSAVAHVQLHRAVDLSDLARQCVAAGQQVRPRADDGVNGLRWLVCAGSQVAVQPRHGPVALQMAPHLVRHPRLPGAGDGGRAPCQEVLAGGGGAGAAGEPGVRADAIVGGHVPPRVRVVPLRPGVAVSAE